MRITGIVLVVLGLLMIFINGFDLVSKKKVADLGTLEISKEEKKPVYWSPVAGIVIVAAGIGLIAFDKNKK